MLDLETRRLFAVASLALRYPERDWMRSFEEIEHDLDQFGDENKEILWALLTYFSSKSLLELQEDYVSTFDRRRKACLYLSYYLNGDTRRRGIALLDFKQLFASEGWSASGEELDDFLPILLEFIAVTASPAGLALLQDHKAGVALLKLALKGLNSPYTDIVDAVLQQIPGEESPLTLKLIHEGPPKEKVGLTPYGGTQQKRDVAGASC